jgi:hypothetical protein
MLDKNKDELETILVSVILGEGNPHLIYGMANEGEDILRKEVVRWTEYVFASKEIINDVNSRCSTLYQNEIAGKDLQVIENWLSYYKKFLITEIREAKLKKLL